MCQPSHARSTSRTSLDSSGRAPVGTLSPVQARPGAPCTDAGAERLAASPCASPHAAQALTPTLYARSSCCFATQPGIRARTRREACSKGHSGSPLARVHRDLPSSAGSRSRRRRGRKVRRAHAQDTSGSGKRQRNKTGSALALSPGAAHRPRLRALAALTNARAAASSRWRSIRPGRGPRRAFGTRRRRARATASRSCPTSSGATGPAARRSSRTSTQFCTHTSASRRW